MRECKENLEKLYALKMKGMRAMTAAAGAAAGGAAAGAAPET